jgi:RNA polymerase sigma-70 factor (ECF subfamily)
VTVTERERLAEPFEENRAHLRGVAYRMLGSMTEAEDAVQEAWLRLNKADTSDVENLRGWLTTVVARVCLDMLRTRKARREESIDVQPPDRTASHASGSDPEREAILADSVGLALLVVLDTLEPGERLAFVLHDLFGMPFEEIAPIVDRTPTAARQLASRARRRVQAAPATPDRDLGRQREVVDAFLAASRAGDFQALVAVLDPDVVLRADAGAGGRGAVTRAIRGAENVARGSIIYSKSARVDRVERHALVNGGPGLVAYADGRPFSVLGFTIVGDKIVEIDILADPARLGRLDLAIFDD